MKQLFVRKVTAASLAGALLLPASLVGAESTKMYLSLSGWMDHVRKSL
jgi:hypothetical protein